MVALEPTVIDASLLEVFPDFFFSFLAFRTLSITVELCPLSINDFFSVYVCLYVPTYLYTHA